MHNAAGIIQYMLLEWLAQKKKKIQASFSCRDLVNENRISELVLQFSYMIHTQSDASKTSATT